MNFIKKFFWILLFIFLPIPWAIMRFVVGYQTLPAVHVVILAGFAIVAASFLLGWVGEVAQKDIPQAIAIAAVAIVAVLPEYAVDMYFAWMAGKAPATYSHFALANMTGSNRLLIGLGWSTVIFVYFFKSKNRSLKLSKENALEIFFLAVASIIALLISILHQINILIAIVLLLLFAIYIYFASKNPVCEPEIHGPQEALASLPKITRRVVLVMLLIFSAFIILISAEPFAESLIHTGRMFGWDEFLMVQWIAPLASEAPEFIVAIMFTLNGFATTGISTLVSSKVNQWTLLVSMIPIVMSLSSASVTALHMDPRQVEEMLLTTAQSIFAIVVILNFRFSIWEALGLLILFVTQLFLSGEHIRHMYSILYIVLSVGILIFCRDRIKMFGSILSFIFKGKPIEIDSEDGSSEPKN